MSKIMYKFNTADKPLDNCALHIGVHWPQTGCITDGPFAECRLKTSCHNALKEGCFLKDKKEVLLDVDAKKGEELMFKLTSQNPRIFDAIAEDKTICRLHRGIDGMWNVIGTKVFADTRKKAVEKYLKGDSK